MSPSNSFLAKDLLMLLLNPDPTKRISAKDALEHEYFSDFNFKRHSINEVVDTRLKRY